ncbi:MAG: L-lysine 2,3-aminomutase [Nitrosomonadaceae bacterium]|nr:L-lysine 2,3-aminomutase [Nitrosomonadaceae bacterium]
MAGQRKGIFRELISPYLKEKLSELENIYGVESSEYQGIARQYVRSDLEDVVDKTRERRRHYEAEMHGEEHGFNLKGVERLYRRTVLLEPTTACIAHCRWCLRGQYDIAMLTPDEIIAAMEYFAKDQDIREILITGGDPLTAPPALGFILDKIDEMAPNIEIVRIGTRVPMHDPSRVNDQLIESFQKKRRYRLEIGIHVCHPLEFWDESVAVIRKFLELGIRIYNQHPLLKGVNDSAEVLIALYDAMRRHDVEAHYLFHAIPMLGMDHHRTSLARGLQLISQLNSGGKFSGRSKPHYAAMTDIGKIVLYEGSVLGRNEDDNMVLLRSGYTLEDRVRYNSSWRKPDSVEIDKNGLMNVWYSDGTDDLPREILSLHE